MLSCSRNICSLRKAAIILSLASFHSQVTYRVFVCASSGVSDVQVRKHMTEQKNRRMGGYFAKTQKKFPETLEGFGYKFNENGELRNSETGKLFKFEVKEGDRAYNQRHYEAVGEVITKEVYNLLQNQAHLEKVQIPVDANKYEGKGFFFMSKDAQRNNKLMILIHGSGVVRAGQWTRKLIINDNLDSGTMLPYIKKAEENGFGVLIPNGNHNYEDRGSKKGAMIRGSSTPEEHFKYIWDNFIKSFEAKTIVIVAHSYGGVVTVEALKESSGFMDRVKAVAFTDSVHSLPVDKEQRKWMEKHSRNWVSSDHPLDTPLRSVYGCEEVSAGTPRHEVTSHAAFKSVFKFFEEKLQEIYQTEEEGKALDGDKQMEDKKDERVENTKGGETCDEPMGEENNKDDTKKGEASDEPMGEENEKGRKTKKGKTSDEPMEKKNNNKEDTKEEDTKEKVNKGEKAKGQPSEGERNDTENKEDMKQEKAEEHEENSNKEESNQGKLEEGAGSEQDAESQTKTYIPKSDL